jgi:hypothetical protein
LSLSRAASPTRDKGIGRIEWRVNGITTAVTSPPVGHRGDYIVTQQLALDPGDNIIELVAYNASNLLASLPARMTIKFTGPADKVKPKLHVLAIGINDYIDQGWRPRGVDDILAFGPLSLAVNNAIGFGTDIGRAGEDLYDRVRLTIALDKGATRENLDKIITKIAGEISRRDTFVLFAAAHGFADKDGRFYLIPQDYDGGPNPVSLAQRAIGQDQLQDWLANRIKANKAVFLLDTCESGALIGGYLRSRVDQGSEAAVGRLHEATGRPVLTAAASGQYAYEVRGAPPCALHRGSSRCASRRG